MPNPTLQLYASRPLAVRVHVRLRWASCPFEALEAEVPQRGRILDVGCGHGLFSVFMRLQASGRDVFGIDPDQDKVGHARAVAGELGITFRVGTEVPDTPWDAITIVDVLYLLDGGAQRHVVSAAAARLAPGGVLVVKDMATTPRWKYRWNQAQETLAVRVLKLTHGGRLNFVEPATIATWMRESGLEVGQKRLDKGYVHPHHLVLGRCTGRMGE